MDKKNFDSLKSILKNMSWRQSDIIDEARDIYFGIYSDKFGDPCLNAVMTDKYGLKYFIEIDDIDSFIDDILDHKDRYQVIDEALAHQTYDAHILRLNSNSIPTWDELTQEDQDSWIYYVNTIFKFEN